MFSVYDFFFLLHLIFFFCFVCFLVYKQDFRKPIRKHGLQLVDYIADLLKKEYTVRMSDMSPKCFLLNHYLCNIFFFHFSVFYGFNYSFIQFVSISYCVLFCLSRWFGLFSITLSVCLRGKMGKRS